MLCFRCSVNCRYAKHLSILKRMVDRMFQQVIPSLMITLRVAEGRALSVETYTDLMSIPSAPQFDLVHQEAEPYPLEYSEADACRCRTSLAIVVPDKTLSCCDDALLSSACTATSYESKSTMVQFDLETGLPEQLVYIPGTPRRPERALRSWST